MRPRQRRMWWVSLIILIWKQDPEYGYMCYVLKTTLLQLLLKRKSLCLNLTLNILLLPTQKFENMRTEPYDKIVSLNPILLFLLRLKRNDSLKLFSLKNKIPKKYDFYGRNGVKYKEIKKLDFKIIDNHLCLAIRDSDRWLSKALDCHSAGEKNFQGCR